MSVYLGLSNFVAKQVTNLRFDAVLSCAGAAAKYFQKNSGIFLGLQVFTSANAADRLIRLVCLGDFRHGGIQDTLWNKCKRPVIQAVIGTAFFPVVLLNTQHKMSWSAMRCIISFGLAISLKRHLFEPPNRRFQNSSSGSSRDSSVYIVQDHLIDYAIGAGWAASREIVVLNTSPRTAVLFSLLSNALLCGLRAGDQNKMDIYQVYAKLSGAATQFVSSWAAMGFSLSGKMDILSYLTASFLYGFSRRLN
jgi:hypothetical protein